MATIRISELRIASKYSVVFFDDLTIWERDDRQYVNVDFSDDLDAGCAYTKLVDAIAIANRTDVKTLKQVANSIVLSRGFEFEQTHPYSR